jgi:hypothetical protein
MEAFSVSIKYMRMTMNLRQIAMSSALVMLANIGIAQAADMSSPSDATSGNPGGTAAAGEAAKRNDRQKSSTSKKRKQPRKTTRMQKKLRTRK